MNKNEEESKRKTSWGYRIVKRKQKGREERVSQVLFWTRPDLTCSQHVSSLVNHHMSGRPRRNLWWSAELLPHRIQAAVATGPSGKRPPCQESSAGLQTGAFDTRLKPNHTVLFTAELSIKHKQVHFRNAIVFVLIKCVLMPYIAFLPSVIIRAKSQGHLLFCAEFRQVLHGLILDASLLYCAIFTQRQ